MADDFEVKFTGLDELQIRLEEVRTKYPFREEEILLKLGKTLKTMAIARTPTGKHKKHLKSKYKLSSVYYGQGGASSISLTNTSPLFHLVEKGHVVKNKSGGPTLGFAPGVHMLENSMLEMDNVVPALVETWLDSVLGDLK
jgi:hypothetical protein